MGAEFGPRTEDAADSDEGPGRARPGAVGHDAGLADYGLRLRVERGGVLQRSRARVEVEAAAEVLETDRLGAQHEVVVKAQVQNR
ncbi:hypothetical protein F8568_016370 [Actinomadura sp. LD22]|uniref:Uncharacterized protein n=1 Tax=Actinomadura physcomitrii TaxID=2650748 RepID=A0A6I4M6Z7_9ACTN|nr:hypothetical protein [Actinomadura physcomitrii]MWA01918.1 hypothetical protein [Actinomadura physcomitrii]